MTSILKKMYIDKLDDMVNKYNNTYRRTLKMKPADVKSNTCIDSNKEINGEDLKFKIGDIVRISKYKNIFAKVYVPNWSEEVLLLQRLKLLFRGHMLSVTLKAKKLSEHFAKLQKQKSRITKNKSKRV